MADNPQVRDYDKFMLRLPPGLRERIAAAAKKAGRSMNTEIVQLLDFTYPDFDDVREMKRKIRLIAEAKKEEKHIAEIDRLLKELLEMLKNSSIMQK